MSHSSDPFHADPYSPNNAVPQQGTSGSTNFPGVDPDGVTSPNIDSSGAVTTDAGVVITSNLSSLQDTVITNHENLGKLILEKFQDLADLTVSQKTIPYPPFHARDTYGPNYFKPLDGITGTDVNAINPSSFSSKFPVYRIFFKGSTEPTDIMTSSVWSICRHKGMFAGQGNESGYYQRSANMTSLHFAGNKHPWNPLILPANPVVGGLSANPQLSDGNATMGDNYMPLENVEAVFHRNVIEGSASIAHSSQAYAPEVIKSNAYRVHLKSGASFDVNAGGYVVTSQPTLRNIRPSGNFDTVEKITRPKTPLVYFYAYGGQYYTGDFHNASTFSGAYPSNTQSHSYNLRTGLAGSKIGAFSFNDDEASATGVIVDGRDGNYFTDVSDPVKGDPLSIDTGATYLPLENVKAITKLNSGDTGFDVSNEADVDSSSLLAYQTYVRDTQNNITPLLNMALQNNERGYSNVYQPADVDASIMVVN